MWGFHADTSTHAIRLLLSGVFDHFPKLKIVIGHMGEGLPFWLDRLDKIAARSELTTIKRKPSEHFLDNFVITTSAMFWDPILELSLKVLGADRILLASTTLLHRVTWEHDGLMLRQSNGLLGRRSFRATPGEFFT